MNKFATFAIGIGLAAACSLKDDDNGASADMQDTMGDGDRSDSDECAAGACTEAYCDHLRTYCSYGVSTPGFFTGQQDCEECVLEFRDGAMDLPGAYCGARFGCWANCVEREDLQGPAAVEDCMEEYCKPLRCPIE